MLVLKNWKMSVHIKPISGAGILIVGHLFFAGGFILLMASGMFFSFNKTNNNFWLKLKKADFFFGYVLLIHGLSIK